MSLICVLVIHHVMVSEPKYTQTKHDNYSPNTHVLFHDIYSKPTQKRDNPYAFILITVCRIIATE